MALILHITLGMDQLMIRPRHNNEVTSGIIQGISINMMNDLMFFELRIEPFNQSSSLFSSYIRSHKISLGYRFINVNLKRGGREMEFHGATLIALKHADIHLHYANNRGRGRDNVTITIVKPGAQRPSYTREYQDFIAQFRTSGWKGNVNVPSKLIAKYGGQI